MAFRKTTTIALGCGLLVALAGAAPASANTATPATGCTVPGADPAHLSGALSLDGTPAYNRWLETDQNRATNLAVQTATDAHFGLGPDKVRTSELLRRGYVGSAIDHGSRTVTMVVTPEYAASASRLRDRIGTAARGTGTVGTAVIVGCHPAARLIAGYELLAGRAWHPDAPKATFGFQLEAYDSRFHVSFDPRYPAAAQALTELLDDIAVVTLDGAARTGRLDDGRPHYGGAGIRVNSGGISTNTCSTGFVVRRNSDGRRGGVSAGHCFGNGARIFSSTVFWGDSWGRSNYPAFDLVGVASAAESYANVIHVDPCCPATRNVTGKRSPVQGDVVCLSGMTTRATCGLTVTNLTGELCDPAGCTYGLMSARRNGETVVRGGDSGGPVYLRSGTSNATVLGVIVGCPRGGCGTVVAERLHVVESHLGVTVVTS